MLCNNLIYAFSVLINTTRRRLAMLRLLVGETLGMNNLIMPGPIIRRQRKIMLSKQVIISA